MRKNPPFSKLETLSKSRVWFVTCWPFLLAVVVLFIDSNTSVHRTRLTFGPANCPYPLQCYVSSRSKAAVSDRDSSSESIGITFTLPMQAILLHYVNVVGRLKFELPVADDIFIDKSIAFNYQATFNLHAMDDFGQKTQTLIENFRVKKNVDVVVRGRAAKAEYFEYDYELGSASLERPWLLPESRTIQGEITLTVSSRGVGGGRGDALTQEQQRLFGLVVRDFSQAVLQAAQVDLSYQRELYAFVKAVVQLSTSFFTLLCLLDLLRRLRQYHCVLLDHSVLPLPASASSAPLSPSQGQDQGQGQVTTERGDFCTSYQQREEEKKKQQQEERQREQEEAVQRNKASSPANRFYFMSFLLAEQVRGQTDYSVQHTCNYVPCVQCAGCSV